MAKIMKPTDQFIDVALRALLDSTQDMVFVKDKDLVYRGCSKSFAQMVGRDNPGLVEGKTDMELFKDPLLAQRYIRDDQKVMQGRLPLMSYSEPIPEVDGKARYASTSKFPILDSHDQVVGVIGISKDITLLYHQQLNYERELSSLFNLPDDAMFAVLADVTDWRIVDIRNRLQDISLITRYDTVDGFFENLRRSLVRGTEAKQLFSELHQAQMLTQFETGVRNTSVEYLRKFQGVRNQWVCNEFHYLVDPSNNHVLCLVTLLDIDERKRAEANLLRAAQYDVMTGVYNRAATMESIKGYLQGEGCNGAHALFIADIDNLKMLNDTFGHQAGDTVLVDVASLLRSSFSEADIVGRIGGDEFLILMKNVPHLWDVRSKAEAVVQSMQNIYSQATMVTELSASIGVSIFQRECGQGLEDLYRQADIALYQAKAEGKNRYVIFSDDLALPKTVETPDDSQSLTINLHMVLNHVDSGIVIYQSDGIDSNVRTAFMNDAFLRMMGGLDRKEALALYNGDLLHTIHPDDCQRIYDEYCSDYDKQHAVIRSTYRKKGKDETYYWVTVTQNIIHKPDGTLEIYAAYTNVDDLKSAEEDLRYKNHIIEIAMNNTDVNLWYYDVRNKTAQLTENCKRIHGMDVDVLENFPYCLIDSGYIREDCIEELVNIYRAIDIGIPEVSIDCWYRTNDGNGWWCERVTLTTSFDPNGQPLRAIGIGQNVTTLKELEEEYRLFREQRAYPEDSIAYFRFNLTDNICVEGDILNLHGKDFNWHVSADEFFRIACDNIPFEADRQQVSQAFDKENLIRDFRNGIHSKSMVYRNRFGEHDTRWIHSSIEMMQNPVSGDIEAQVYVIDINQKKTTSAMMEKLLADDYEMLAQINAYTGEFLMFSEKDGSGFLAQQECGHLNYDTVFKRVLTAMIEPHYLEEALGILNRDAVVKYLDENDYLVCSFPVIYEGPRSRKQWKYVYLDETKRIILISRTDVTDAYAIERDALTTLYNRRAFYRYAKMAMAAHPKWQFSIVRFDIDRFKAFNDLFGTDKGDQILLEIGHYLRTQEKLDEQVFGRMEADHFVCLLPTWAVDIKQWFVTLSQWVDSISPVFRLTLSAGVYDVGDASVELSLMCDRALLAQSDVKEYYTNKIAWYHDGMRQQMIEEQMLVADMDKALEQEQFVIYFQPQIDYSDGSLIGAEALVRWIHPERGLIPPNSFIPLFEKNGFISKLDEYVWDKTCAFMRKWMDDNQKKFPVPLSVNISRIDIYDPYLCDKLLDCLNRYSLYPSLLKLEITESAYMDNPAQLIATVHRLKFFGFCIAMDDFGAGYSSLNTLKDVPVDILKLDVRFLSAGDEERGGNILSSVIRMARWLKLPVISEGVETKAQADYLKSLSCTYMQGYYFSRPIPTDEFLTMLDKLCAGTMNFFPAVDTSGVASFWDPSAQSALLFNSFLGGAAIIEYHQQVVEVLRANDNFFTEMAASRAFLDEHHLDMMSLFDEAEAKRFITLLDSCCVTGAESTDEIKITLARKDDPCQWIFFSVRLLARNDGSDLLYLAAQNVTQKRILEDEVARKSRELEIAISHFGGMVCTYDVATQTLKVSEEYARRHGFNRVLTGIPYSARTVFEEDRQAYNEFYENIMAGRKEGAVTIRFIMQDGHFESEELHFTTIFAADGKPSGAVVSIRNITA